MRVGIGYDVHRFAEGRRLILGGIELANDRGLEGHSDADVLLHAIMDALLGAAALGDIGHHFPPSDMRWKDASSLMLLGQVYRLLDQHGWRVGNVDATVIAERPKVAPYIESMRAAISAALDVESSCISIKATTNERMGFVGRGEGIAALATALITEKA